MLRMFRNKSFWVILVLVIVLLTVMKMSAGRQEITGIERVINNTFAPLQAGLDRTRQSVSSVGTALADKKKLLEQVDELQAENNRLHLENQQLREFKAEATRLQRLCDFSDQMTDAYTFEAARVIGRSPNNWSQAIVLDKGSNQGIEAGMTVICPQGLVGRVITVNHNSCRVWLLTDREMAVGVVLQETRQTRGIVEGTGESDKLRMINIPYYSKIKKGQRVITSGLSEHYPKGLLLGKVKSVQREKNGLLLSAVVEPAVDFDKLEEVLVIIEVKSPTPELDEEREALMQVSPSPDNREE